jgi:hypothetical protein
MIRELSKMALVAAMLPVKETLLHNFLGCRLIDSIFEVKYRLTRIERKKLWISQIVQ